MRLDSLVWGLTYLYPSSMRGMFDSDTVTDSMDTGSKTKVTDLYEELYSQVDNTYNPYSLIGFVDDEDIFM